MGEANYYFKAKFRSELEAEEAALKLSELLRQRTLAYDYWQSTRSWQPNRTEQGDFWGPFRERFLLVYEYLESLAGGDSNNALAGHMSFVDPMDPESRSSLVRRGDELHLMMHMIWHFSNLTLLQRWCMLKLGAVATGYNSDEYMEDYFDEDDEDDDDGDEPLRSDEEYFSLIEFEETIPEFRQPYSF